MRIWITGPMTGYANFNRALFEIAEKRLYEMYPMSRVLNPASEFDPWLFSRPDAYDVLLDRVLCCMRLWQPETVVLLEDWEYSQGACFEVLQASALGAEVVHFPS